MKEHYFKQKIYPVDRLKNRQLYIEVSVHCVQQRHQEIIQSVKGGTLSVDSLHMLKNTEEKVRLRANKEFSQNYWSKMLQSRSR